MIRDILTDVTKITNGLAFDTIRVIGDQTKTEFKSMVDGGSVMMKATAKKPIPEFVGKFGLGNLDILRGYLGIYNSYDNRDAVSITVNETERNGEKIKTDISFKASGQSSANYRLVAESALKKIMVFTATEWDVILDNVQKSKISDFDKFSSVLNAYSKTFGIATRDGKLYFTLGDDQSAVSKAEIEIGETTNKLNSSFKYPVKEVMTILRNPSPTIHFTNRGFMMVKIDSGLVDYEFTFKGGN